MLFGRYSLSWVSATTSYAADIDRGAVRDRQYGAAVHAEPQLDVDDEVWEHSRREVQPNKITRNRILGNSNEARRGPGTSPNNRAVPFQGRRPRQHLIEPRWQIDNQGSEVACYVRCVNASKAHINLVQRKPSVVMSLEDEFRRILAIGVGDPQLWTCPAWIHAAIVDQRRGYCDGSGRSSGA